MHSILLQQAQQAWVPFLSQWDWVMFSTNTFKRPVHFERADRTWNLWIRKMNRELYGRHWEKRGQGLFWVRASERQRRGALHYHSLIAGERAGELDCARWTAEWERLAGLATMEQVRSQPAAQLYILKDFAGEGQIDLGGLFP